MLRIFGTAAALAALTVASATAAAQKQPEALPAATLDAKVYTASPEGFLVNSTLVTGAKDAILIDAQFTLADAHRVVAWVIESKKNLTHVYITHSHPDHYFGLEVIKQAFPKAKIVALPATVARIKKTAKAKLPSGSRSTAPTSPRGRSCRPR
jgi:glyoxylase-like metal-dependent hydrolase (beta-lactamase superfamily II)